MRSAAAGGSTGVVAVALAANLGMATAMFAAAAWTGSSAMLAAAILALASAGNQGMLLLGIQRARQPADGLHPFGYAREPYFWGYVVAILLFSLGAGVALFEGVEKLLRPRPVTNHGTAYIVLAAAVGLMGLSAANAVAEFKRHRRGDAPALAALRASNDPALFTVLIESMAALTGLAIAVVGVAVSDLTGRSVADGYAAILIGLLLGAIAALMSVETRSLIIGEAAAPAVRRDVQEAIVAEMGPGRPIRAVNEIRTMQLGPTDVLVVASVDFEDGETAAAIEASTSRIEETIRTHTPAVRRIFIEGQSARDHAAAEQAMSKAPAKPHPVPVPVQHTAATQLSAPPASAPSHAEAHPADAPTPSEPAKQVSRKARKRQKHRKH